MPQAARQASRARAELGQTMAEYAIVLAVVAAGVVTTLGILRADIVSGITQVAGLL